MKHIERKRDELATIFADLISPISTEEFFSAYWEKSHLHVRHPVSQFADYFSLHNIEAWVRSTRSGLVFVLLPGAEGGVRFDIHQARDLSPGTVLGNFRRGFAQILKRLADWPNLQGLVHHLSRVFHADIQVNAFLTPAGATTHPTYSANDDILVLQVEGDADWQLHEFSVLQLDLSQKRNLEFPEEWQRRTETPVLAKVHMQPGDLLFIPRGMPHFATPPISTSLQLRIYITPLFWADFLKFAAEYAAVHSQELRRALPPGFVGSDETCDRMRASFQQVMEIFKGVSFDGVLAAVKRNRVAHQGFPCDGQFDVLGAESLTVDSEVERRPDVLCTIEEVFDSERNRKSTIFFGAGRLSGPPHLYRALDFIRNRNRFWVAEIPGLDEKGQLVLVRRLIAEGLLRLVPEEGACAED